jgi:uncharacterized protein YegL
MFESLSRRRTRQVPIFLVLAALTGFVAHAKGLPPSQDIAAPVPAVPDGSARIEVAFVLDTTGSMSGLLEGAKATIWSIANQLATGQPKPDVRIGLVGYRDRGDAYVTRRVDLTGDIDAVYAELFALRGGGDTPESVNQALHEAVTALDWSTDPGVYRVLFLVGDAPPHIDYQDDVAYSESVRLARARGIVVNTVQCGALATTTPVWREIAGAGAGQFAAIAQDRAMVTLSAPMDDELASLNRALAKTVLAWGAQEEKEEIRQKVRRSLAAAPGVAASRLSYLDKTGGRVNSGRRDLLDALEGGLVALDEVSSEELPSEMSEMDAPAREAYVAEQQERRRELQGKISVLSRDRDAWVRAETERLAGAGGADGFDQKVLEAIRTQAAEKGIAYE